MIYNEDAYYTGYYRNVRALGAIPALVFDTIAGLVREDGKGEIANSTLMEILGCSKPTLLAAIEKLINAGMVEKKQGDGRGNKCIYYITEKGKENCPFMREKGSKIFTKRVKKFYEKGKEICPINKELNKELKESGDVACAAREHHALSNTTTFFEEENINKKQISMSSEFDEFWKLYPGDPNWSHEKEHCENFWRYMSDEWRAKLIKQLRAGLRWRVRENDNPIWYLRNYKGEDVKGEMPCVRQGTVTFEKWLYDAERTNTPVAIIRYEEKIAYCYESDLQTMLDAGATFIRKHTPYVD
jgi:DNA-binding HxlR family transcriptional regulator